MSDKTSERAFPRPASENKSYGSCWIDEQSGMTLWDYFAAHAPEAVMNDGVTCEEAANYLNIEVGTYSAFPDWSRLCAAYAAYYADAMIAEREKRGIK